MTHAALANRQAVCQQIADTFALFGERYLGDTVSLGEHLLQTTYFAEQAGEITPLVVAALLHDYGALLDSPNAVQPNRDYNAVTVRFLERHFTPAVTQMVRLQVLAKRYLCTIDPAYHATLTPTARERLAHQGGLLASAEIQQFERQAYFSEAVRLRRYADMAKFTDLAVPPFGNYRPHLLATLR